MGGRVFQRRSTVSLLQGRTGEDLGAGPPSARAQEPRLLSPGGVCAGHWAVLLDAGSAVQSPCCQPVTSGRRPSVLGGRAGSRQPAPTGRGECGHWAGPCHSLQEAPVRQRRRRLHVLEGPVGRASRVRGPPAPGAAAGAMCGGVPHCVLLTCRGRSARLVPEEKMAPKALRVVEGQMATPAPWGPLGRRYAARWTTFCGEASVPVASGILAGNSVGPKPPEGATWFAFPPPRHSRQPPANLHVDRSTLLVPTSFHPSPLPPRKGPSSRHPQSVGPVSGFHVHRLPGGPPRAAVLIPAMSGCGRPPAHPSSCPRHRPARAQEQGSSAAQTPAPSCPKTGTPQRAGQSLLTANSSVQPLPPASFV